MPPFNESDLSEVRDFVSFVFNGSFNMYVGPR